MTKYDYRCAYCADEREREFEMGRAPKEVECEVCGGPSRKLISRPAVAFRGKGFYSTDSRRPGNTG